MMGAVHAGQTTRWNQGLLWCKATGSASQAARAEVAPPTWGMLPPANTQSGASSPSTDLALEVAGSYTRLMNSSAVSMFFCSCSVSAALRTTWVNGRAGDGRVGCNAALPYRTSGGGGGRCVLPALPRCRARLSISGQSALPTERRAQTRRAAITTTGFIFAGLGLRWRR